MAPIFNLGHCIKKIIIQLKFGLKNIQFKQTNGSSRHNNYNKEYKRSKSTFMVTLGEEFLNLHNFLNPIINLLFHD